jgi:ABC-type multidrug transport system fused ATPase/permease subunit
MKSTDIDLSLFKLFYDFYKENPSKVLVSFVFILLIPFNDIVLPHYFGEIMDAMKGKVSVLKAAFIKVIVLLVIIEALWMVSEIHDSTLLPKLQGFIRDRMFSSVLETYETSYAEPNTGELITQFVKLPLTMTVLFERVKNYILPYILMYIAATIYFCYYDVTLGLTLFVIMMIFISLILMSPVFCNDTTKCRDQLFNEMHEEMEDVIRNLFSVYGTSQEEKELGRIQEYSQKYVDYYKKTINCTLKLKLILSPLVIMFLVIFMARCFHKISNNEMSGPVFVPLFIILLYLSGSMFVLNDQLRDMIMEWGIIQVSSKMFKIPVQKSEDRKMVIPYKSGIGVWNVSFTYPGAKTPILRNVFLHIPHGERVAIIGDIGSGKSTLIKMFMRYNIPDSGAVYFEGHRYGDLTPDVLRKKIGYVPQYPILFNRTLIENILYGNTHNTVQDVVELMKFYGFYDEFAKLEHGLDTRIGKNGSKISGGQRQLVWCLRILLMNPEVLILDEPTASVDNKTKDILQKMFDTMMRGKTVIMVTHDDFLRRYADRIITMQQGEVINDTRNARPSS